MVTIAGRSVGEGNPCFIIAEAGVNHNGDLHMARQMIDAAVAAGADAIKFQTFRAEKLVSPTAPKAVYQAEATGGAEPQLAMLAHLELPFEAFRELRCRCEEQGIMFLSTPFDEESADFLESMGLCAFKIASGDITNLPFLERVARYGKPMIVSTGMASMHEITAAVSSIRRNGLHDIVLLHCVSSYPAEPSDINLHAMATLRQEYCVPVGFSDHTTGVAVALAAVALGACVVEKHFTLDRNMQGPDHLASLEPEELGKMVHDIRTVEQALGSRVKQMMPCERDTAAAARKSIVASKDILAGSVIGGEMIDIRRPGTGLPPAQYGQVLGKKSRIHITAGTPITPEMIE